MSGGGRVAEMVRDLVRDVVSHPVSDVVRDMMRSVPMRDVAIARRHAMSRRAVHHRVRMNCGRMHRRSRRVHCGMAWRMAGIVGLSPDRAGKRCGYYRGKRRDQVLLHPALRFLASCRMPDRRLTVS